MSRRLRAFAITVFTACLMLAGLPAIADEAVDGFIALPFTTYGDMLVDSAHGQVFVTGGDGYNEIAVVKLDGSGVTMIPNAPGATKMSMTQDGRYVYATLRNGDGIAQIDTTDLSLRRFSTGAGSCPTEVAAVADYVWFVASGTDCNQWGNFKRLDPATGTVAPDISGPNLYQAALRVLPGTTEFFYAETGISRTAAGVYDAADGTLTPVSNGQLPAFQDDTIQLTNDGDDVIAQASGYLLFARTRGFSADGVHRFQSGGKPTAYAADDDFLAFAQVHSSRITMMRRGTDQQANSIALGATGAGDVVGIRLDGARLFAVTRGSTLRLYQVDQPGVAAPDLTLDAPAQVMLGDPVTVSGVLSDHGVPIPGATVTVRQDGVEQPVGSPSTDADGRYSLEFTPQDPGTVGLSVRYDGGGSVKAAITRAAVSVIRRSVTLTLGGPSAVWPDGSVPLDGTLFDGSDPLTGVRIDIQRQCWGSSTWEPVGSEVTDSSGAFATADTPGPCSSYEYVARYDGDDQRAPTTASLDVDVNWAQAYIDVTWSTPVHVGETLDISGTLTTPDGPLPGRDVAVNLSTPSGRQDLGTFRTDGTGWFGTSYTTTAAGSLCYHIEFDGDSRNRSAGVANCTAVTKWPTNLTMSGPTSTALDEPVLLSGRLTTSEGEALRGVELTVSRTDKFQGTQTLPTVVTGADGSYVIRDVPPNGGDVTYAAAYAGSASRSSATATLNMPVSRPQPNLTLTTDRQVYDYGQTGQLDVDLATDSSRTVQVYAQEVGRARTTIYSGDVPAGGLTLQYPLTRNTTFTANVPEDGRALAASASVDRSTRAGLSTKALGSYGTSGSYKLYRPSADPRFAATLSPARDRACLTFDVQRHYSAGWRTVSTSPCVATGDASTATWKLTGTQATKTGYRVRPSFAGDDLNAAKTGAWVYFKFV